MEAGTQSPESSPSPDFISCLSHSWPCPLLSPHSQAHEWTNLHGAEMFKWVNIGLRATSTRMGRGVEKKCGESPANRLRSMWMGTQPQGGEAAAGWALGALRAIPRPFPTADSAPTSLSPPQHSHTTPTTQPHPTATLLHQLPSPSLPHPPHVQQRKSFTFASQLCRSFSGTITSLGGRDQKQIPFLCRNLLHAPAPTAPQHRLAGGQRAAYQSPWSPRLPPRNGRQSG